MTQLKRRKERAQLQARALDHDLEQNFNLPEAVEHFVLFLIIVGIDF